MWINILGCGRPLGYTRSENGIIGNFEASFPITGLFRSFEKTRGNHEAYMGHHPQKVFVPAMVW
jgi:hypothetical protein